jgi:hypothetical protein
MLELHDLWSWLGTLKASPLFAIALPILLAKMFASIVDWVEGSLVTDQAIAPVDGPGAAARQHLSRRTKPITSAVLKRCPRSRQAA